jgi:sporulation protein YlmC with PRC-barrel domain
VTVHVERLLGRRVVSLNGRVIGRLEEIRAERRGAGGVVVGYVIGPAGLLERLIAGRRRIPGVKARGVLARWDQLDVTGVELRLRCPASELQPIDPV